MLFPDKEKTEAALQRKARYLEKRAQQRNDKKEYKKLVLYYLANKNIKL